MNTGCKHVFRYSKNIRTYDDWTGEYSNDIEIVEESAYIDLDLHRYQCKICKKIEYYSNAAKNFYENGVKSDGIKGLN